MSMQIKAIILYHASGKRQIIPFKLGKVNIITGNSDTGKSAIIPIIEYCLGQSDFNVPGKIIRKSVAWYAVLYQIREVQVFIAKRAPVGSLYQNQVCYKEGTELTIPDRDDLKLESDDYRVKERLLQLLHSPSDSYMADSLKLHDYSKTSIDNVLFYLFQNQHTIADNEILFHRQQGATQKIKETLPYLLGVVEEAYSKIQQQLSDARNELATAKRQFKEKQRVIQKTLNDGRNLIVEARHVGLIDADAIPENQEEIIALLNIVVRQQPEPETTLFPSIGGDDRLSQLDREIEELEQKRREISDDINKIKVYATDIKQYGDAVNEHLVRLESIHLFEKPGLFEDELTKRCPLCSSELQHSTVKIATINRSLVELHRNLNLTERRKPRLDLALQELEQDRERIRRQIRQKQAIVEKILEERHQKDELIQRVSDANTRTNRVLNRIEYYLETLDSSGDTSLLQRQIEEIMRQIEEYQNQLAGYSFKSRQNFILQELNISMTRWARRLELQESSTHSYQFDIDELTVKTSDGHDVIPMRQMGGHENYLGCHLILLLSLHRYFVKEQRPIPHFLILDQPAQGYFPSVKEYQYAMDKKEDSDMIAVQRMFNFLFDFCDDKDIAPNFQLIILEHANLENDPRFQDALVEGCPWTGNDAHALIPEDWIVQEPRQPRTEQITWLYGVE